MRAVVVGGGLAGLAAALELVDAGHEVTLVEGLDRRSALCVSTFAGLYRATLERIEAAEFDVFGGPPGLSPLQKLRIVGSGLRR